MVDWIVTIKHLKTTEPLITGAQAHWRVIAANGSINNFIDAGEKYPLSK